MGFEAKLHYGSKSGAGSYLWNELSGGLGGGIDTTITLSNNIYTIEIRNVQIPITVTKSLYMKVTLYKVRTP